MAALQVPVGLAATQSGRNRTALRTLHRGCHQPLRQALECPVHGEVPEEERVAGWEVSPGEFVLVERDELDEAIAVAVDVDEHVLETVAVVAAGEVDPAWVRKTYWLTPGEGGFAVRGYRLVSLMLQAERGALLVRFQGFGTDHVAAVVALPELDVLLVEELALADDVCSPEPFQERLADADASVSDEELELARELVGRLRRPLDLGLVRSQRRDAIRSLLELKLAERGTARPAAGVVRSSTSTLGASAPADLLGQLRASLKQAPRKRARKSKPRRKQAVA